MGGKHGESAAWFDEQKPFDVTVFRSMMMGEWSARLQPEYGRAMTQLKWVGTIDPIELAQSLPDVAPPGSRAGYEHAHSRRFRWLAAELFRFLSGPRHWHSSGLADLAADEFAKELAGAEWLDAPLLDGGELLPGPRRMRDHLGTGLLSRTQHQIAQAFMGGAGVWPHTSPNRSPCNKGGIVDLLSVVRRILPGPPEPQSSAFRRRRDENMGNPEALDYYRAAGCGLIREAFRGPGPWPAFRSEWRTDTVLSLRRTMKDYDSLKATPILADALQDAGCDDADLLDHLRQPDGHTTGCWALDLIGD